MKLLIITQKIDLNDPVLGFFHNWVRDFSLEFENIIVICLEKGFVSLPSNVTVLSLGKEDRPSRFKYLFYFFSYLWSNRNQYQSVFVHMNQEYILLAGWWWKLTGKKISMWRNHHAGNFLTKIACFFCDKVFCTSKFSYTARFKQTVLMPVGIDTTIFQSGDHINNGELKILFLGRIAPVKKPHILIEALSLLQKEGANFVASFYGDPLIKDQKYLADLKKMVNQQNLSDKVTFHPGITNNQTPSIYRDHNLFINLSSSGMYDKTIFEAMASGLLVLVTNLNLRGEIDDLFIFEEDGVADLVSKIKRVSALSVEERKDNSNKMVKLVQEKHSLEILRKKLSQELNVD